MDKDAYLFPTAVIRSHEAKLLDKNDVDRMLEASDIEGAYKIFNDLSYSDELANIEDPREYRLVLEHDLLQLKEKLVPIIPDQEVADLIFLRFDFHNIKLIFKEKLTKKDFTEYGSHLGQIDVAKLREYIIRENKGVKLPDEVEKIINDTEKKINEPEFLLDTYLDKRYLQLLQTLAEKIKNQFISEFIEKEINAANVKAVLRARKLKLPAVKISSYLIENTAITINAYTEAFQKGTKELVDLCVTAFWDAKIKEVIRAFPEHEEVWRLEKEFDNYEIRLIKPTKYIGYGPEIILAFFLAKSNTVKNLRLIMAGKFNKIDKEEIRERVREIF